MASSILLYLLSALVAPALAAFGVTESGGNYVVDTAGGLVFSVGQDSGDIVSLVYNGVECQDSSKMSQVSSGLGAAAESEAVGSDVIKITVDAGTTVHYYIAKNGDPTVYMGTYISSEPEVGELRYIARLNKDALTDGVDASQVEGGSVVEGSDVFLVDGETRSKFYSSVRFIEDDVHCATGDGLAACMAIGSYEGSSGGPFFRDIDNQGSEQQEVYFYMNSNHAQTEAYRMGFHGPYALMFTDGGVPTVPDFTFYNDLDLEGWVPESSRGYVSGTVSGATNAVVHFHNDNAQYFLSADSTFTSPAMKPGTYTMTLYQTELKVAESTVSVSAGKTTTADITSTYTSPAAIFRIGAVDGTPQGFLNADKQLYMHPTDARMSDWGPVTYTVDSSSASSFPMAQIQAVNDPTTISFTVDSTDARTLKIWTTLAFASGRPLVTVNGEALETPAAPTKIDSRGLTRGAYRGRGEAYEFVVENLVEGENTIAIGVASGSSGEEFLSPNFIYDAVELY